jgi:hypothetical protein
VKEQLGHSSIQVTVDTYDHLVPGADVSFVDRLDAQPGRSGLQSNKVQRPRNRPWMQGLELLLKLLI